MDATLNGIKIIDLSRLFPGPYATAMMAAMGADVIKVEAPGEGDYLRSFEPMVDGQSAFFLNLNANKRSVVVDLKNEAGKKVVIKMVRQADVVIESFRPGVMERLGLGYGELEKINPAIVYCAITGYGSSGPFSDHPGHDINYLALSGLLSQNRSEDGWPVVPGFQIADVGGGALHGVIGIMSALIARQQSGRGRKVEVSMTDALAGWLVYPWSFHQAGIEPDSIGPCLSGQYPCYAVYKTKDEKFIALGALEPKFWANLCGALGREDLLGYQFSKGTKRDWIFDELRATFAAKDRDHWVETLGDAHCCVTPVVEINELSGHPHWVGAGLVDQDAPGIPAPGALGNPIKFPDTEKVEPAAPPSLGEHTEEILLEFGYDTEEIVALRKKGAVG